MEIYEENLRFFEKYDKTLYDRIMNDKGDYEFCLNEHGCPDILYKPTSECLYNLKSTDDLLFDADVSVDAMRPDISISADIRGASAKEFRFTSPFQSRLYDGLAAASPIAKRDSFLVNEHGGYLPFVRVYGVGLGYHIIRLIETRRLDYSVVYEPSISIFRSSLHTIPWWLVVDYFVKRGGDILISVGIAAKEHAEIEKYWLTNRFRFLVAAYYRLVRLNSSEIENAIGESRRVDGEMLMERGLGWYEDQRAGLFHSIKNYLHKLPVFTGRTLQSGGRCFIVGSGPSLSESIGFIKENVENAIIFSCGSALFNLLGSGIVPDYQLVMERYWIDFEDKLDKQVLKKIKLIQLNAVYHKVSEYYESASLVLKINDPGMALLSDMYPGVANTHPSVTNMGVTLAASLGFDEIWMFGCDYGRHEKYVSVHAEGGYYERLRDEHNYDDNELIKAASGVLYPGAQGGVVLTNHIFAAARSSTEIVVGRNMDKQWYRVGNGAAIEHVTPMSVDAIKSVILEPIDKIGTIDEIGACFSDGYVDDINYDALLDMIEKDFSVYIMACWKILRVHVETRSDIVRNLRFFLQAADQASHEFHLSGQLLAGSLMLFVMVAYVHLSLCESDEEACLYYGKAKEVLLDFLNECTCDAIATCKGAVSGDMDVLPFMTDFGTKVS